MNYYNEHDAKAAAWMRELIKEGLIADGDVDERSIVDVQPGDLAGYTQCHWFAGIGGWSLALRLAGWPDDRPVWTGSCPCQPFSSAGSQAGGDDPRHLWPAWFRLIKECRPAIVFGEQVAAAVGHGWLDLVFADLEASDYACGAVIAGAHSVGAPHIRQRLWFVAERVDNAVRGGRQHEPSERCVDGPLRATGQAKCVSGEGSEADSSIAAESKGDQRDGRQRDGDAAGRRGFADGGAGELADAEQSRERHVTGEMGALEREAESGEPQARREAKDAFDGGATGELADALNHRTGRPSEAQSSGDGSHDGISRTDGAVDLVADAERGTAERHRHDMGSAAGVVEGAAQERQRLRADAGDGESVERVADAEHAQRRPVSQHRDDGRDGAHPGRQEAHGEPGTRGEVRVVADPDRTGQRSGRRGVRDERHDAGRRQPVEQLGHAERSGREELRRDGHQQPQDTAGGSLNPWADLVWLPCRDGKARPTQPGLQPLAHGISARVGRLRGYGNAIVPQVAAEVIRAYLETTR